VNLTALIGLINTWKPDRHQLPIANIR